MAGILALRKGDALQVRVAFTNQSDGSTYNMTGWTLSATLRFANCTPVDLTCSWTSEVTGVGLTELSDEQTNALPVGDHEMQVRATSPAGKPTSSTPVLVRVRD